VAQSLIKEFFTKENIVGTLAVISCIAVVILTSAGLLRRIFQFLILGLVTFPLLIWFVIMVIYKNNKSSKI
jgi:hypothetical protein